MPPKGSKMTEEQRRRVSEAKKDKPSSFKGKHHTEETKQLLSLQHMGKPTGFDYRAEKAPAWRGGIKHRGTRILQYVPDPDGLRGYYRPRADIILEEKLGRKLEKGECAHHINLDCSDDRPENLEPRFRGEHTALHHQLRRELHNAAN